MNVLDEIITPNKTYYGVVDYSNKKHIVFFDTTQNDSPDIILLVISWRCLHSNMRFSVYRDIFFPDIDIPVILIPRKNIINQSDDLLHDNPTIQKKTVKKKTTDDASY